MKQTINSEFKFKDDDGSPRKISYPYIGIFDDFTYTTIVLFQHKDTGVVLFSDHVNNPVGRWNDEWAEEAFEPFIGNLKIKVR